MEINWDNYQPVQGHAHLYRDKTTGAIINMDFDRFGIAKKKEELARKRSSEENALKVKVNSMENDIADIKVLLQTIVENIK